MSASTVIYSGIKKKKSRRLSQQRRLKSDTWMKNKATKCGVNVRGYKSYLVKGKLDQKREKNTQEKLAERPSCWKDEK